MHLYEHLKVLRGQKRESGIKRAEINLQVQLWLHILSFIESWLLGADRPWVQWAEILPLNITAISTAQNILETYHGHLLAPQNDFGAPTRPFDTPKYTFSAPKHTFYAPKRHF